MAKQTETAGKPATKGADTKEGLPLSLRPWLLSEN